MVWMLVNNSFQKDLVQHGKKTRTFLGLYIKTHLWACTRLEKMGGLVDTRNWSKIPISIHLVLLQIIYYFVCLPP